MFGSGGVFDIAPPSRPGTGLVARTGSNMVEMLGVAITVMLVGWVLTRRARLRHSVG